ncbi:MAG: hypothetical protein MJ249_08010 [Kiritimatiellae bacterium]|nr:hypothetical protein [Kiritimatiellia bacterium]
MANLQFFRLDAPQNVSLEISGAAEKLVFRCGHVDLLGEFLLDEGCCANQVCNLEEFVVGWLDALGEFGGRQESRRENTMQKVGDWRLSAVVVDFESVKSPQFGTRIPKLGKLALNVADDLFGRVDESLVDGKCVVEEVGFTDKSHHRGKYLGTKLPSQNCKFICLPDEGPGMKAHAFNAQTANLEVEFPCQSVNRLRLVMEDHRKKIEARGRVRRVKYPRLIDKDTQDSFVQTAPSKYESDGNRFSSLKAKNILRVSVIPSLRKTSQDIITHFKRGVKGRKKKMKEEA